VIAAHHGATLFSDARGAGRRARPQHLYTVAFAGGELWGEKAEPGTEVCVDLFESYLMPA
jgi:nitrile hydratase subunit beta